MEKELAAGLGMLGFFITPRIVVATFVGLMVFLASAKRVVAGILRQRIPKGSSVRADLSYAAFMVFVWCSGLRMYLSLSDLLVPGLHSFELSFTKNHARRVLAMKAPAERTYLVFGLGLDFAIVISYSILYMFLCVRHSDSEANVDAAASQLLVGLAHIMQNWYMLKTIVAFPDDMDAQEIFFMGVFCVLKALLCVLVWVYLIFNEVQEWIAKPDNVVTPLIERRPRPPSVQEEEEEEGVGN